MRVAIPRAQIREKHEEACDSRHCYNRADIYHNDGKKFCTECETDEHSPQMLKALHVLSNAGLISKQEEPMSAASEYYDYDRWVRSQHMEDPDDQCTCAECRDEAEQAAADHAYDLWHDRA